MNSSSIPLEDQYISQVLNRLHQEAKNDGIKVLKALGKGIYKKITPQDVSTAYLSISQEQGQYMYNLIVQNNLKNIIEFGTSFGVSTIYLAAAARKTKGKVITTEIIKEKCTQAQRNFKEAQLEDWIELREGDAAETLKDIDAKLDFLLLDGWKNLYAPIFDLLKSNFHSETKIFVDNTNFKDVRKFIKSIRNHKDFRLREIHTMKGGAALIELR